MVRFASSLDGSKCRPEKKYNAAFLQSFGGRVIEEFESFLWPDELAVTRSVVCAQKCQGAPNHVLQRGVFTDPEHTLLRQLDVDLIGCHAVKSLHIRVEAGGMKQTVSNPVPGKFPGVAHLPVKQARMEHGGEYVDPLDWSRIHDVIFDRDRISGHAAFRI